MRELANKNFELLKSDPRHPSLHFKKMGKNIVQQRVGIRDRALGVEIDDGILWFWIRQSRRLRQPAQAVLERNGISHRSPLNLEPIVFRNPQPESHNFMYQSFESLDVWKKIKPLGGQRLSGTEELS